MSLELARIFLNNARRGDLSDIERIISILSGWQVQPEEIGTTQKELDELFRRKKIKRAKFTVSQANQYGPTSNLAVRIVGDMVTKRQVTLEEIGTTQQKLDELIRLEILCDARYLLHLVEKNGLVFHHDGIVDLLSQAKATPEEIGTTQERLDEIKMLSEKH